MFIAAPYGLRGQLVLLPDEPDQDLSRLERARVSTTDLKSHIFCCTPGFIKVSGYARNETDKMRAVSQMIFEGKRDLSGRTKLRPPVRITERSSAVMAASA